MIAGVPVGTRAPSLSALRLVSEGEPSAKMISVGIKRGSIGVMIMIDTPQSYCRIYPLEGIIFRVGIKKVSEGEAARDDTGRVRLKQHGRVADLQGKEGGSGGATGQDHLGPGG